LTVILVSQSLMFHHDSIYSMPVVDFSSCCGTGPPASVFSVEGLFLRLFRQSGTTTVGMILTFTVTASDVCIRCNQHVMVLQIDVLFTCVAYHWLEVWLMIGV